MEKLTRWFRRAGEICRHDGVHLLPGAIWKGFKFRFHNVWTRDHPWQGRLVEIFGNRWRIHGMTFSLDNPAITRRHKALLFNGSYEAQERRMLGRHLPGDLPLVELGGCVGVLACIANARLGNPESHVVVEANPKLISTLERNRDLNGGKFRVVHAAIAHTDRKTVQFTEGAFTSGSVGESGLVTVDARTLRSIADEAGFQRFDLICDIEGMEEQLIELEGGFIKSGVRMLIIEMHPWLRGADSVVRMHAQLLTLGFELVAVDSSVRCYRNSETRKKV